MRTYDRIIVGAGAFGLHAAHLSEQQGMDVLLLDREDRPMERASRVNQARLHMGYHYPRSLYTARTSALYFHRFRADFPEAVNSSFDKVYAIARHGSLTSADRFEKFCRALDAPLESISAEDWFAPGAVDQAWLTKEYSIDADRFRGALMSRLGPGVTTSLGEGAVDLQVEDEMAEVQLEDGSRMRSRSVVLASYAGCNALLATAGLPPLPLKYELCEMVLVDVGRRFRDVGLTVMDGPFFSLMPFGHTGLHSFSSVPLTPRRVSRGPLPTFDCQSRNERCSPTLLDQCDGCHAAPNSAWPWMMQTARRYLASDISMVRHSSIHAMKTVLATSEIDDGRPTLITHHPTGGCELVSVLSGKINSIYDLEDVL